MERTSTHRGVALVPAVCAWTFGAASIALALCYARWNVFHPHWLPLVVLYFGLLTSTLVAAVGSLRMVIRGPRRRRGALLALLATLPICYWFFVGFTAYRNGETRELPNNTAMRLAKAMGASVARAELDIRYKHRLESNRIVMFYNDLRRPGWDLAEMDRFVARLERDLGGTVRDKVYWVRGGCVGTDWASFHGISMGSNESPDAARRFFEGNTATLWRGDRHELAHAALDSFRTPGCDPPNVLHEGWAMAQCGDSTAELAREAQSERQQNPAIGIRELLGPEWYHRGYGPVYTIGGAFVDFLLRTRGTLDFRDFYIACQPGTVDMACRETYGIGLDDLEAEFWADVEKTLADRHTASNGHGDRT